MASKYTYEDFQKAMASSGLSGQFSQSDLKLAQQNPDAGMSILKYKQDWNSAATDEARALANYGAEQIRSNYGGYTGGESGGSFYLDAQSPKDFQFESYKPYENQYADREKELLDAVTNYKDFSYDPTDDRLYSQYRKQYTREGQRATADTLGAAAAASGGVPSSYAATAAAQAGNYYSAQMTDKIPELYELAYNQYLNEYNRKLTSLEAVQAAEQSDYAKYLNELEQHNTQQQLRYNQLLAEIEQQSAKRNEQMNLATLGAQWGDYSGLEGLGFDLSNNPEDYERKYQEAILGAQWGDYSGLNGLGISTANNPTDKANAKERVDAYLAAGGSAAKLDSALVAASGYTTQEMEQLERYYALQAALQQQNSRSASSGSGTSSAKKSTATTGSTYEGLYNAGVRTEGEAYAYLLSAGHSSTEAAKLAGYFGEWVEDYTPAVTLDAGDVEYLKSEYGSRLPGEVWNDLVSNQGLSEDLLKSNGFTVATTASTAKLSGYAQDVEDQILGTPGMTKAAIQTRIEKESASGKLTTADVEGLYKRFGISVN